VREDESASGDAWNYCGHDLARSRAYRWGEDGLAGICDDRQILCFALALWNGQDPVLKERLFGLTNGEGNHGEDVKEYYFYLDNTPTHSYMRYLYKYPQRAYPYVDLVETNRRRPRTGLEYELLDTGIFDDDRYFDVFVEYAKATPEDVLIEITVANRGPEEARLHLLPTLWFRNTWSVGGSRPSLRVAPGRDTVIAASSPDLGERYLHCQAGADLIFCENETNPYRVAGAGAGARYFKDGIDARVVRGDTSSVNPEQVGTKASAWHRLDVPPGDSVGVRLRLTESPPGRAAGTGRSAVSLLGARFTRTMQTRKREADEFYAEVLPARLPEDRRRVMRQALAGMLWSKQFYDYDVAAWLKNHGADPFNGRVAGTRNIDWPHMVSGDVISMPDKWEYPWYAAWDLAFHAVPLAIVDPDYAKEQLLLLLQERYMHPNGQMPAYEWNFGDVNPPVHAWSAYFVYQQDRRRTGHPDVRFLRSIYEKLLMNFTWWVNRKDLAGRNVFEGGFLGLDNIGVFDRSAPLPSGGHLEPADGTAWMAFYAQVMLQISLELTLEEAASGDMALKFFEHFVFIASAMNRVGGHNDMWDEEDGFFYDILRTPDGKATRLKVRSMAGLLPLCASTVLDDRVLARVPQLLRRASWFIEHRGELVGSIHDPRRTGYRNRRLLAIVDEHRLRRILARMLDENEFLSPFGIRSLSRAHAAAPYSFVVGDQEMRVGYLPAESDSGMFGGNSNWRGPIFMPVNALLIRALLNFYGYYGDSFVVECPTGSRRRLTLYEVAEELTERLTRIFTLDQNGHRPVFGGARKFLDDPRWRDNLLFYEYFHGDSGAGIGASHQTGWTGLIVSLMHYFATVSPAQTLALGSNPRSVGRREPRPASAARQAR
jgi:hypothetical protein